MSASREAICHLLQSCTRKKDLAAARRVYSLMVDSGLDSVSHLGDHIIRIFASCGSLLEAQKVFRKVVNPTVHTWHAIISAHSTLGEKQTALDLYHEMQNEGIHPNKFIFSCILKACAGLKDLLQGKLIHGQIIKSGLESDVVVGSALVDMHAKCGNLEQARKVFDRLRERNVVSWNTIITGYVQHGHGLPALELFKEMQQKGIKPDRVTFLCVLKACGSVGTAEQGKLIHEQIIEIGLESDMIIGNTLVDMYAKCGDLQEAHSIFERLPSRDVVSWSALIAGYCEHGHGVCALELLEMMQQDAIRPEKVTFLCMLKACGIVGALGQAKLVHDQLLRNGLGSDVVIGNTLIDMYAKCGSLELARSVFDVLPDKTAVSWNAMLAGYTLHDLGLPALELFDKMLREGVKPSNVTFSCILKACSSLGASEPGGLVHYQIIRSGLESDMVVGNTLVDMYAKFGNMEAAHNMFDQLSNPDVVSWGALIAGYAEHGLSLPALENFVKMQQDGVKPDKAIFLCIFKVCGTVGALNQGNLIHDHIIRSGLAMDLAIGNTVLDMYAKCGSLNEAQSVFDMLSNQNVVSWNALIAGCVQRGHCRLAMQCFEDMQLQGVKPVGRTYTSILSACSHAGQVEDGHWYFKCLIKDNDVTLSIEHFNCMIDLLGRAGCLNDAKQLLHSMPIPPNINGWMSLLTSCSIFGNVDLGRECFDQVVQLDSLTAGAYVLMLNIYANAQMWKDVNKMQELRKFTAAWKKPGEAWLEVHERVHKFTIGDKTHPQSDKMYFKLKFLSAPMREQGHVPHLDLILETNLDGNKEADFENIISNIALLATPEASGIQAFHSL